MPLSRPVRSANLAEFGGGNSGANPAQSGAGLGGGEGANPGNRGSGAGAEYEVK